MRLLFPAALLLLAATSVGPAVAQYPRAAPGQFEVRGLDFRPAGGWRARTRPLREHRRALLAAGDLRQLREGGSAPPAGGSLDLPVLLVRPSDVAAAFTASQYHDLLFADAAAGRPYTLRSYYRELSGGRLALGGAVLGWWTAPQNRAYYEDGCNGVGVFTPCPHPTRLGELLVGALRAFDGAVEWGRFDNDGPDGVPNSGDDDGVVDFVTFVHPDVDGACGTAHLWSHRWVVSAATGNGPFLTRTPRSGRPGEFLLVEDYILTTGVGGATACDGAQPIPIGTIAHETGHALGLPDLYDTGLGPERSQGIGEWGLMGSGALRAPLSPARMEAWSLAELGWVTVHPLTESGSRVTGPVARSDTVFHLAVPGREEFFLLENRQRLESDVALHAPGLLVWHVDAGRLREAGYAGGNAVNSGPVHGVALVQADGRNELRAPGLGNRGDAGDPYPGAGANHRLSWQSRPAAADNRGRFAGFMLDQIGESGSAGDMRFRLTWRPRSLLAADAPAVGIRVGDRVAAPFDDVLVPGEPVTVAAPEAATSADGRSRYHFLGWSNGQPAAFVLTPGTGAADTLVARYAVEHRIRVVVAGTGTVAAAADSVVGPGAYVGDTVSVSLLATPAEGAGFVGWAGDTVTTGAELRLPGGRPYDLMALFTVSPAVFAVRRAVDALLRGTPLAPGIGEGLDAGGNRNGRYDVGDLLAFLDHAGVDPAVLTRLAPAGP